MVQPLKTYPYLSDAYVQENKPHLDRMRAFLDDLLMPFKDRAVELSGLPIEAQYQFRHLVTHPPDMTPYYIRIMITRGGRGCNVDRSMEYYEFLKDRPEALSNWEMFIQEETKREIQAMLWSFLEDYKHDRILRG